MEWQLAANIPQDGTHVLAYFPRHPFDDEENMDEAVDLGGVMAVRHAAAELANEADALIAQLLYALREAENALADYIPTIEKAGASLNYGHAVLNRTRAAIAAATGEKP